MSTRNRIRLLLDSATPFALPIDLLDTGVSSIPQFPRAYDLQVEVGLADAGALLQDISHIASLTLEIKRSRSGQYAPSADDPVLMSQTLAAADLNPALTLSAWESTAEADAHAQFTFTAGETAHVPAGSAWLAIHALTTDSPGRRISYLAAPIQAQETGAPSDTAPEPPLESYYTQAQSDARYLPVGTENTNFRIKNADEMQLRETSPSPGWRTVWLEAGILKFGPLDES